MKWMKFLAELDLVRSCVRQVPSFQKGEVSGDHPIIKRLQDLVDEAMQERRAPTVVTLEIGEDGKVIIPPDLMPEIIQSNQTNKGTVFSERIDSHVNKVAKSTAPATVMVPRQADVLHINREPALEDATEDTVVK